MEETKSVLKEEADNITKEYYNKWGWLQIAKDVAEYTNISFFDCMNRLAVEVLTLGTMMKDEIEVKNIQNNFKQK